MGRIVISENVSVDGVSQDPTGEEGFSRGGWASQLGDADRDAWAQHLFDEAMAATALLLGRRSDEWFADRWLSRGGAWADRLNALPKYVVSASARQPRWSNSTVLAGDLVTEVSKLRQELDGDIVVYGSTQLVHALLENGLADELRLIVYPIMLGAGERLLGETTPPRRMRLTGARALGDGLACLSYELVSDPVSGSQTRNLVSPGTDSTRRSP